MPMRKTLGVIGGVGPLSTAYFMEVLINKTNAVLDQDHVDMVVLNHCEIPDRTAYILDNTKANPVPFMKEDAIKLEKLGCSVIATPCNTAHYFYHELQSAVSIPIINMIEETALALKKDNVKRAGIMATNGTVATNLFQDALIKQGIQPVIPNKENQQFVMDIIYDNVKAGVPIDLEKFKSVVNELRLHDCDRVILGCTELSILKREYSLGEFYVDSLEVLCERAIEACGKNV
ncbi:MAG: amino acid racemase, partial [Oscillospiraceae bacterium]